MKQIESGEGGGGLKKRLQFLMPTSCLSPVQTSMRLIAHSVREIPKNSNKEPRAKYIESSTKHLD